MRNSGPLIQLQKVYYDFDGSDGIKELLKGIDLQIHEGEWLSIVGSNGCGKSTLAKVAAGLYPPSAGSVERRLSFTREIRLVFQNPDTQLIGDTVYEDVCFGMEHADMDVGEMDGRALEALNAVGILHLKDKPVAGLSGGQKQLAAIASCLAVNPSVLIFDEATSMLDPLARGRILKTALALKESGKTIVWITQLLDELAWSDRIIALEDGEMMFSGTKEAFFYENLHNAAAVCERLGFAAPYTVKVARALMGKGYTLNPLPFTPDELAIAVGGLA